MGSFGNPDFAIQSLTYNAGESIADRIGKDNMTQVLEIIRDQMLSTVQKRNMLKLIYGLYDEEIINSCPMILNSNDLRNVRPIAENINDPARLEPYIREAETLRLVDAIGANLYRWLDETDFPAPVLSNTGT